nr:nitrous oxide reductase family maturation protein NosD [Mangrovicella endophytica]
MRPAFVVLAAAALLADASCADAKELAVPAGQGTLAGAIASAEPGDVLRLGPGDYNGSVLVDKTISVVGDGSARVVGPGSGTVISITAGGARIEGLVVTGSGNRLDELDSGIAIAKGADGVQVISNRVEGNLIGVDVQGGKDALVRGNQIANRVDIHPSERGSGLYVWNAPGLVAEDNTVRGGRDGIFVSSSHRAVYRNNRFYDLRFAFHSMYANNIEVTGNVSEGNELGFAFMYSNVVIARDNLSRGDQTHGLFLNSVNKAVVERNAVRDGGEKCLFIYNANRNRIADNVFEGCELGVHFTAGSEGNVLTGNAFIGNQTQVKNVGTRWFEWSDKGRGNYWSDHVAFDIDGDGIADAPYRPNDTIDLVTWRQPMAKLLLGSPAVQLIRWSQSRFPGLLPGGVIDSHPLTHPGDAGPRLSREASLP